MSTEDINEVLINACVSGNLQDVKRLLAAGGADVNADFYGRRPLIEATEKGHVEVVQFLLDNGADIDGIDNNGQTAIHFAASLGRTAFVDLLAFRGAEVEKNNYSRYTPLIGAAFDDNVATIETLVHFGADVDAAKCFEVTTLMLAAEHGKFDNVRLLLSLNADTTKIDIAGRTAFQFTRNDAMIKILLEHEEKTDEERKQIAKETMISIQHKVSIRLMRFAQDTIIGICLAFASLELPPYVLLWIIDFLPQYHLLSHHKKIELITSVRNSIWKLKGRE